MLYDRFPKPSTDLLTALEGHLASLVTLGGKGGGKNGEQKIAKNAATFHDMGSATHSDSTTKMLAIDADSDRFVMTARFGLTGSLLQSLDY